METNNEKNLFKKHRDDDDQKGIGFAILLILVGITFLLFNVGVIPYMYKPILISWQMLLIAIGVWQLIKQNYAGATVMIAIGAFFLYPKVCVLFPEYFTCFNFSPAIFWPLILIAVGILIITSKQRKNYKRNRNFKNQSTPHGAANYFDTEQNSTDFIDKNIIFRSSQQIVLSSHFMGGEGNVMFGELIIDLRKAKLAKGSNKLDVNVMFGSAIIHIPSDWDVEIQSSTIFGSIEDNRSISTNTNENTDSKLIIKFCAMFGGGEIKS